MLKKFIISMFFFYGLVSVSFSNNLQISSLDAVVTNESANTMSFVFNIKAENSWRNTQSHDAFWIFIKYSLDGGKTWQHASMLGSGVNPSGFSTPQGFEVYVPQDNKGFIFRRKEISKGNVDAKGVAFVWNYGQDGVSDELAKAANTLTRVYAIEMVFVPEGAFFAGDGISSSEFRFKKGSSDDQPWYIASENAIATTNAVSGGYYYQSSNAPGESNSGEAFLVANSFPKGFKGFYLMKYELSEGEWVNFFNTLSLPARFNRDITSSIEGGKGSDAVVNRNTVAWDSAEPFVPATTQRPARAMTYISWPDAAAFADWAALRPMTELEFEKAARGSDIQAIPDEFAWGSTAYNAAGADDIFPPNQNEDGTESLLDGSANLNRNTLGWNSGDGRVGGIAQGQKGPLRSGIFSEASTSRQTSGSGYYGAMELSGNLSEMVVSIGRSEGRQFLGTHGDGELSFESGAEGFATNVDWPGINSQDSRKGVTGTLGMGYRSGDYQSASIRHFQLSSRTFATRDADSQGLAQRSDSSAGVVGGARFVRSAQ